MQSLLFDLQELKPQAAEIIEDDFDYEADDAEAVVYIAGKGGWIGDYFVMKRHEAIMFCSSPKTAGRRYQNEWAFFYTTHRRDWYEDRFKTFRPDDGRFVKLLNELGVTPIFYLLKSDSTKEESE